MSNHSSISKYFQLILRDFQTVAKVRINQTKNNRKLQNNLTHCLTILITLYNK